MTIDLDHVLAVAKAKRKPWEFAVAHDGQAYAVRELTEADAATFRALPNDDNEKQLAFAEALFIDPKPDVRSWPAELLQAAVIAVLAYFAERRNADTRTIGDEARREMVNQRSQAKA